ncbi:MAG TPA: hypothetical protein VGB99_19170 [Acidobacteriota bacterium]
MMRKSAWMGQAAWLAGLLLGPLVAADTIVLINGEQIHSALVKVEKDRVHFRQLGGMISVPRREVARIIRDETADAPVEPRPSPSASGSEPEPAAAATFESGELDPAIALDVGSNRSGEAGAAAADPESAEYWRSQRDELLQQKAQLEQKVLGLRAQMILNIPDQDLRRDQGLEVDPDSYDRALAEAQADLDQINERLADLEDEARKAGAARDWNRE